MITSSQCLYQLPKFNQQKNIFHAFSTREAGDFGAGSGTSGEVTKRRASWLKKFSINFSDVITLRVAGGTDIFVLNQKNQKLPDQFDSVITNLKNQYFVLIVADCLPIIIFDPKKEILALVHAGWRGLDGGIIGKTIKKMVKNYGLLPQDLIVGIGPAIDKNSYIKDKSFREKISAELNKYVFDFGENKVKVDLISAASDQLESCGVKRSNIEISDQNTFSGNYFSHHRAGLNKELDGRNMAVVGLK